MKADLGCHKGKPKLVRPMDELVEEIRGVGDEEDSERAEEEVLEEAAGGEVEEEHSGQKAKNRRHWMHMQMRRKA